MFKASGSPFQKKDKINFWNIQKLLFCDKPIKLFLL
jgi:hypothetical protein